MANRIQWLECLESRVLLTSNFGDAPDTSPGTGNGNYQTLSTDNGPSHVINATQTTLFLGARVDGEIYATPNSNANGDDITTSPDDEEGLIDTNRNGVFENGTERTSVAVPGGTANGTFTLTFLTVPASTTPGKTCARFRLSTDIAAANSNGAATGGEVEDYAATINQRSNGIADSAKNAKIASGMNGGPELTNADNFGNSVASLGDLDGDGVTDLAVGANGDGREGYGRGAVHVLFLKAAATPTVTWNALAGAVKYDLWIDNRSTGQSQFVRNANLTETSWTPVAGAASYNLFVNRTDVPVAGIINLTGLTTTSHTPVTPLQLGTYRAWGRAVSTTGELSPWSLQVDFSIAAATGAPHSRHARDNSLPTSLAVLDKPIDRLTPTPSAWVPTAQGQPTASLTPTPSAWVRTGRDQRAHADGVEVKQGADSDMAFDALMAEFTDKDFTLVRFPRPSDE